MPDDIDMLLICRVKLMPAKIKYTYARTVLHAGSEYFL